MVEKGTRQNQRQSLLLKVGKLQKSSVQMVITKTRKDVEHTHEMNGVSVTKKMSKEKQDGLQRPGSVSH